MVQALRGRPFDSVNSPLQGRVLSCKLKDFTSVSTLEMDTYILVQLFAFYGLLFASFGTNTSYSFEHMLNCNFTPSEFTQFLLAEEKVLRMRTEEKVTLLENELDRHRAALEYITQELQSLKQDSAKNELNIAFHAYLVPELGNVAKGHIIVFNNVTLNIGNGYDSHVGIFIASVNGTYAFSVKIGSASDQRAHFWLMKNDQPTDFGWSSTTTTLELAVGDKVWVEAEGFVEGSGGHHYRTSFDGHLIGHTVD